MPATPIANAIDTGLRWAALCAVCGVLAGCNQPTFDVSIMVKNEEDTPLYGVSIGWDSNHATTDQHGMAALNRLRHPVVVVLSHDTYLDEPVVVGWDDADSVVSVKMLSDGGGRRVVIHSGGDAMLGRRYENPEAGGDEPGYKTGLITPGDGGASARELVSSLVPAFALADVRTLNLESTVGLFDDADAYPGKRWILRTDPDALAALDVLGIDAVLLANNHLRDFLEPGIAATLEAAAEWELTTMGGGIDAENAEQPLVLERNGQRIGVLAYTTVDGDYVNDSYPRDGDDPPEDLKPEDAWQWEFRLWGWAGPGAIIPWTARRIGSAWDEVALGDPLLAFENQADLWDSVTEVYPELQDWVARRGHGGGALWQSDRALTAIAGLRSQVDVLVVNLHSGYQYAETPSPRLRQSAYDAIDAGADLVVGHHPHVLQGVELYHGKLIAWSLGNLVFDQDFLATFPSAFLRTVWEDGELLEARLIPLTLEAYRPVPVADAAARYVLRATWERGLLNATAQRGADAIVRSELQTGGLEEGIENVGFRLEGHAAVLRSELGTPREHSVSIDPGSILPIEADGLVWSTLTDAPPPDIALGRSLFGWGGFEDVDTDGYTDDATHWKIDTEFKRIVALNPWHGRRSLQLYRSTTNESDVLVRPVARIPIKQHRLWWDEERPADGAPSYSLHGAARVNGQADLAKFRLDFYHFDDANPTTSPVSALIRSVEYPLHVPSDGEWHELWIDVPAADMASDEEGREIGAVMLNIVMVPATRYNTTMWFDEVDLVVWRNATDLPPVWGAWDWIRSHRATTAVLDVRTLSW